MSADLPVFTARDLFAARHIGPSAEDQQAMLASLGYATLDDLTAAALPPGTRPPASLATLPAARTEQEALAELRRIAEAYFEAGLTPCPSDAGQPSRVDIRGVLHLVDARHPGLDADLDAARWLESLETERAVVATKVDKLTRNDRAKNLGALKRQLGTAPLPFSAASGEGLDDLWTLIARLSR